MPVFAGYISLGIAFGILLQQHGYGVLWAFAMSAFIYAGSAQFLCVGLLAAGAGLLQTAILTFVLNFRHFFYGLSMIAKYRNTGKSKIYLIFGLTDETYAILSTANPPEGIPLEKYYLTVTLLNHLYWVVGSVLGTCIGNVIRFNTRGLDFAMTALFTVLAVEQWKTRKDHRPALTGLGLIILSLCIFGADNFLIPGLIVISAVLLLTDKFAGQKEKKING